MKKILLSVIFAVVGMMATTNVMAATPNANAVAVVNGKVVKLMSKTLGITEADADGKRIEGTTQSVEVTSFITIADETITITMGDEEPSVLKVVEAHDPIKDNQGTRMVMTCVDSDGERVNVVLITNTEGEILLTVHEEGSIVVFVDITVME